MNKDRILQLLSELCDAAEQVAAYAESHPAAEGALWELEIQIASARRAVELGE